MNPEIRIELNKVSDELILDFAQLEKSISINIQHHPENVDHFEGPADIVIYVNEHLTELIAGGLLVNAVWDALKLAIAGIWKKIVALKAKNKSEKRIEIKFKVNSDNSIEFELDADIESQKIEKLIDAIFSYLKDKEKLKRDFNNPAFKAKDDLKPRIRIRYNSEIKDWEIVNFENIRKQNEELMKLMVKRFNA